MSSPDGWCIGVMAVDRVGGGQRRRRGGAERRQRPAAVGDAADPRAFALAGEQHEGEVARAARVGAVPGGQRDGVGVDALHVGHVRGRARAARRRRRARALGDARRRRAARRVRGRRRSAAPAPSSASRAADPSGRSSTATAPRRLSAATTASALGRVPMSTPTCSPWRTPTEIRPRTTLSMRRLTAAVGVAAAFVEEEHVVRRAARPARRAAGRARCASPGGSLQPVEPRQLARGLAR